MIIRTESLRTALNVLKPVLSAKTTITATEYVLIKDGYISGTDLSNSIRAKIESTGDDSICVTYKELLAVAESCKDGDIHIESIPTGDGLMCHFKSGRRKGKFPAIHPSDMVLMDFIPPEKNFEMISLDAFQYAKLASEFTIKDDLARPAMELVHFIVENGLLYIAATNGHVMILANPHIENQIDFNVSVGCNRKVIPILKEMTGKVKIGLSKDYYYYGAENIVITSRSIDANFPNIATIKGIIGYEKDFSTEVNLKEFLDDVKSVSYFAKKESWLVILNGNQIIAEDIEYNKEMSINSEISFPKSGFNSRNLLRMPSVDVAAKLSFSQGKPLVVEYSNIQMLVMPIMID